MPELPEVETVARQLASLVEEQQVRDVRILDDKLGTLPELPLKGAKIHQVQRLGKQVLLHFNNEATSSKHPFTTFYLAVHLRMTGRLLWRPSNSGGTVHSIPNLNYVNDHTNTKDSKYSRAVLHCKDGDLEFVDVRRFGTWKFSTNIDDFAPEGIDPLTPSFTLSALTGMLARSQQNMKQWLLRQDRLVGLGNIYVCEILFRTGISPLRPANTLKIKEVKRLFQCIPELLQRAIEHCGTTFSDFQQADGEQGSFQHFLHVYQKEGEPCKYCGNAIARIPQNGRSTFFCPCCQR